MTGILNRLVRSYMLRHNVFDSRGRSVDETRQRLDRLSRFLIVPAGTRIKPVTASGVPSEWVVPRRVVPGKAILYIHGGGWTICSTRTHRPMVARLAQAARVQALSIDYRLAPEHKFPAALDDSLSAYKWLLEQGISPDSIVIAGDSAGGNLTLACLLALRDGAGPLPAGAVCLSPATDLAGTGESFRTKAAVDPVLILPKKGPPIHKAYTGDEDVLNPLVSPLYGDLHGLPPILIHVGEDEILLDDSTRFVEKACSSGVDARVVVWKNMMHVFQAYAPFLPDAQKSINLLGNFIRVRLGLE